MVALLHPVLRVLPLALAMLCAVPAAASSLPAARPNLLLILADNWGWPHASALGDPVARTPAFDRVAREGVVFRHAFCPVPSCSPTRASLLTGRPAHQLEEAASLWSGFPMKFAVFTAALRDAGYEVGATGKAWSPGNFRDSGWADNPVGRNHPGGLAAFLAQRDRARPFFFWLGNTDTASHNWRNTTADPADPLAARVRVPPELPDTREVRATLLTYYAAVGRMDVAAAAALSALEQAQILDDTVIIYTSDNGWQLPRGLANCHDTGTRVPFAVRWGRHLRAGRTEEAFVSLTDLAPTFLELAGLPPSPEMTGRSLVGALLDRPGAARADHVFLERERHANVRRGDLGYPVRGIRTRDWLYLHNLRPDRWPAGDPVMHFAVGDYGDVDPSLVKETILARRADPAVAPFFALSFAKRPAEELYDLRADPHQLVNLAGRPETAAVQRELRARVERWMRGTADPRVDPAYDGWDTMPYYGPPPRPAGAAAKKKR
jgi:arylsulfatase A-like enzyme